MKTIWKFPFDLQDEFTLAMPRGAEILHADVQQTSGQPTLWAVVDPEEPKEPRTFRVHGTGRELPDDFKPMVHVATFQSGPFVWHLFDQG